MAWAQRKMQDIGEMLQVSYLAVFIIAGVLCIKICLVSIKEFLPFDLFMVYNPKF